MLDHFFHEEILPSVQFKSSLVQLEIISSCSTTCHLRKEDNLLNAASFQVAVDSDEISVSSRLNSPSSLNLSSCLLFSNPFTSFTILSAYTQTSQCPSCNEGPKTDHSIRGVVSLALHKRGQSLPLLCWPHYFWRRPGSHWPSWPPNHTASSCSDPTIPMSISMAFCCYGREDKIWTSIRWYFLWLQKYPKNDMMEQENSNSFSFSATLCCLC